MHNHCHSFSSNGGGNLADSNPHRLNSSSHRHSHSHSPRSASPQLRSRHQLQHNQATPSNFTPNRSHHTFPASNDTYTSSSSSTTTTTTSSSSSMHHSTTTATSTKTPSPSHTSPAMGSDQQGSNHVTPVHCFWALMSSRDLRFIYLSSSVQRAVSAKYKQLLGMSFFDYIHPDEAALARKDLDAFMDVHNLYGSVTRCRFKNVCPEWQQRKHSRSGTRVGTKEASLSAQALQAVAEQGGLSSRGLGQGGLQPSLSSTPSSAATAPSSSTLTSVSTSASASASALVSTSASSFNHSTSIATSAKSSAESQEQRERDNQLKRTFHDLDSTETDNGRKKCPDDSALHCDHGVLPEGTICQRCEDAFPNGEEDDYMILDVVMNVVSDDVVLGFFHIDGQGLYQGFWSGNRCGEPKDSLGTFAPEIMRHLQDSASQGENPTMTAPTNGHEHPSARNRLRMKSTDEKTKRIFQIYDSQSRDLLLTWPHPNTEGENASQVVYNPDLYTQIVKSHHIPEEALKNTTCLKRFCSKQALPSPNHFGPQYQIESVFIPYGQIIFTCFQTSISTPLASSLGSLAASSAPLTNGFLSGTNNSHESPHVSSPLSATAGSGGALNYISPEVDSMLGNTRPEHLAGVGMNPSEGSSLSNTGHSMLQGSPPHHQSTTRPPSTLSNPLVIPALPSYSPFLKQTTSPSQSPHLALGVQLHGAGSPSHYSSHTRLGESSSTQARESADKFSLGHGLGLGVSGDFKANESSKTMGPSAAELEQEFQEPMSSIFGPSASNSIWRGSTPHPAMVAITTHAQQPASEAFYRNLPEDVGAKSMSGEYRASGQSNHPGSAFGNKPGVGGTLTTPIIPRARAKSSASKVKNEGLSPESLNSSGPLAGMSSSPLVNGGPTVSSFPCTNGGLVIQINEEDKACESCGTTNSPEWRKGPSGKKNLCNACGLRYSRSVARQNRQAQKLLEGKGPKVKANKTGNKKQKVVVMEGNSLVKDESRSPATLTEGFLSTGDGDAGSDGFVSKSRLLGDGVDGDFDSGRSEYENSNGKSAMDHDENNSNFGYDGEGDKNCGSGYGHHYNTDSNTKSGINSNNNNDSNYNHNYNHNHHSEFTNHGHQSISTGQIGEPSTLDNDRSTEHASYYSDAQNAGKAGGQGSFSYSLDMSSGPAPLSLLQM